jgi:hypothetical protein
LTDFERGQWHALNKVLALLNTYDEKVVAKGKLYDDIMELRPVSASHVTSDTYDASVRHM